MSDGERPRAPSASAATTHASGALAAVLMDALVGCWRRGRTAASNATFAPIAHAATAPGTHTATAPAADDAAGGPSTNVGPSQGSNTQRWLILTAELPSAAVVGALRLAGALELDEGVPDAVLWSPAQGPEGVGLDVAHELVVPSDEALARLPGELATWWSGVEHRWARSMRGPFPGSLTRPRLFGGVPFAFADAAAPTFAGRSESPSWRPFRHGRFVLPRWLLQRQGDRAWLSLALRPNEHPRDARPRLEALLTAVLPRPEAASAPSSAHPREGALEARARMVPGEAESRRRWLQLVAEAQSHLQAHALDKVVLARRTELELPRGLPVASVVESLAAQRGPTTTLFAVRRYGATFVGLSPERLVAQHDGRLWTEALAGSRGRGTGPTRDGTGGGFPELLASAKDLREHAIVVAAIRETLGRWCTRVDHPVRPELRPLRDLVHLHTPIVGYVDRPVHLLEVARALHPTPAVGGMPREAALRWIQRHEPMERGWYASPVGWVDAEGEGELVVALRSALLHGGRAAVFAGAGILAESDPLAELRETQLKQQTVLRALGLPTQELHREPRWSGGGDDEALGAPAPLEEPRAAQ
jgi:salicylate biosynthesis isochorismate synthase